MVDRIERELDEEILNLADICVAEEDSAKATDTTIDETTC